MPRTCRKGICNFVSLKHSLIENPVVSLPRRSTRRFSADPARTPCEARCHQGSHRASWLRHLGGARGSGNNLHLKAMPESLYTCNVLPVQAVEVGRYHQTCFTDGDMVLSWRGCEPWLQLLLAAGYNNTSLLQPISEVLGHFWNYKSCVFLK